MASSRLSTFVLRAVHSRQLRWQVRCLSSSSPKASKDEKKDLIMQGDVIRRPGFDPVDLNFNDHVAAFKSKTNFEVFRSWAILSICRIKWVMDHNLAMMNAVKMIMPGVAFKWLMKATFFGQFVAGEDEKEVKPAIKRMNAFGVKAILDYSAEEDTPDEEPQPSPNTPDKIGAEDPTLTEALGHKVERDDKLKMYASRGAVINRRKGVTSARTFFYHGEAQCEKNMEIFLRAIDLVRSATEGEGFAAIKVTALGRPQLLLQLSEALMRTRRYVSEIIEPTAQSGEQVIKHHVQPDELAERLAEKLPGAASKHVEELVKNMTFDQQGVINLFSWGGLIENHVLLSDLFKVPSLKTGKMMPLIDSLTAEEEKMFANTLRRMTNIFQYAYNQKIRVMVDAEQTYFQPAISRLCMEMMTKFNKETPIVFNTYQCYLKNAHSEMLLDLEQANRQDFYFGAKLVRGAYMEQERERAQLLGYEDPVNPHYDATTEMYKQCLVENLMRAKEFQDKNGKDAHPKATIMVASHNEDTIRYALRKMEELDIDPSGRTICFGQLYGMCDQMSFPLGQGGFSVYKYVPYGPIYEVMPYMSRRVTENGSTILEKSQKERRMLLKELARRIATFQWFYKPKGLASG